MALVRRFVGRETHRGDDAVLEIADCIRELARRYDVREVALDPWRAATLGAELEREGLTVSTYPQQDSRVIPASQRLYDAIIHEKLVLPDLRELAQHAAGAIAKHSRRGWRIDRPNPRARGTRSASRAAPAAGACKHSAPRT